METKVCKTCGIEKWLVEFETAHKECRLCRNTKRNLKYDLNPEKVLASNAKWVAGNPQKKKAQVARWVKNNYEKVLENGRRWRKAHYELVKDQRTNHVYGITSEEHDRLFVKQDGRCAICGIDACELKKLLHIDHDHKTGKIRGLLCEECNHLLGNAKDNIIILQSSIDYLEDGARSEFYGL